MSIIHVCMYEIMFDSYAVENLYLRSSDSETTIYVMIYCIIVHVL